MSSNIVEKTFDFRGKSETVYFRRLTAGEQLKLAKGQKVRQDAEGKPFLELDLGEHMNKGYELLQMTLVQEDGRTKVYKNMTELLNDDGRRVRALVELANDVVREEDELPKT
jgi:hypothetical protein